MYRYAQTNLQLYEELRARGISDLDLRKVAEAYDFALRLFGGRYRGAGKPFLAHLIGTASVLLQHGASLPVVIAGLLHASYRHAEWGNWRYGETAARQRRLVEVVGQEVEELIRRYNGFDFMGFQNQATEEAVAGLSPLDRQVLLMGLANDLEECLDRGLLYAEPDHREEDLNRLPAWAKVAEVMGHQELAEELRGAYEESKAGAALDDLPGAKRWPYTLAPQSHLMRPTAFAIRVAGAIGRRLPRPLARAFTRIH